MAPGGAESDSDQIFLILSVCDPMDLVCYAEITYPAYWYHNQSMAYVYVLKFWLRSRLESVFTHVVSIYANLLEQKKAFA